MECSPASLLDPARNWGLSLFRSQADGSTHFALGIFQAGTDANDFEADPGSTIALTGRLTATPVLEEDGERLLHMGAALSSRFAEQGLIVVNQQPQSPLIDLGDAASSPFVPTIRIPADVQQLANLQLAAARGPLWTQAEWYGSWIDQQGGDVLFFHGCYAECGCFVTGEHRSYQSASGTFGPVRVERPLFRCRHHDDERETGWGAWELAARYAYLDFLDSDVPRGPGGELVGIRLPEATFGVNWHLTDHARLMFNYSYVVPQEPNTGTSAVNLFAMRLGVFW
jgi:phosphate-selective porin OprO and OprP